MPQTREIRRGPSPEKVAALGSAREKVVRFLKGTASSGDVKGFLGNFGLLVRDRRELGSEGSRAVEELAGSLRKNDKQFIEEKLAPRLTEMVTAHTEELSACLREGRLDEALQLSETTEIDRAAAQALGLDNRAHREIRDGLKHQQSFLDKARKAQKELTQASLGPDSLSRRRFLEKALKALRVGGAVAGAATLGWTGATLGAVKQSVKDAGHTPVKEPGPRRPSPPSTPVESPSPIPATSPSPAESPKAPEKPINLGEEFLKPFVQEAQRRREIRDTESRIDTELNKNRLNILLLGYGEEHGDTYEDFGGSLSFISLQTTTLQQANINLSRDIRCPENEETTPEGTRKPMAIRYVYRDGGFDLMRKVAERATGLSADFQVVLKDTVIRDFIKQITGSIMIPVDKPHQTNSYSLGGQQYPAGFIPAGLQEMDAEQAMQFILAEDINPGGKADERSYRKNILMKAIKEKFFSELKNPLKAPLLIKKSIDFYNEAIKNGDIIADFDSNLLINSASGIMNVLLEVGKSFGRREIVLPSPEISRNASIHDPFWGDGSVSRVHNIRNSAQERTDNSEIVREARNGLMPEWMLIPDGGDPYAPDNELIEKYWKAIRRLVKKKLS